MTDVTFSHIVYSFCATMNGIGSCLTVHINDNTCASVPGFLCYAISSLGLLVIRYDDLVMCTFFIFRFVLYIVQSWSRVLREHILSVTSSDYIARATVSTTTAIPILTETVSSLATMAAGTSLTSPGGRSTNYPRRCPQPLVTVTT